VQGTETIHSGHSENAGRALLRGQHEGAGMSDKEMPGIRVAYAVVDLDGIEDASRGIAKKITSQAAAFRACGLECDLISIPESQDLASKVLKRIPFGGDRVSWDSLDLTGYDALYLRRPSVASKEMMAFLKDQKSRNPDLVTIEEIPTYPYDEEMKGFKSLPLLLKDRWNRRRLNEVIDRIAVFSDNEIIFSIPTIKIINGVDLHDVGIRAPSHTMRADIIFVAAFAEWHGADRLLDGLKLFRDSASGSAEEVHVHMVGGGPKLESLKRKAAADGLSDLVTFYGVLDRSGMDRIYDRCDFAVASLGLHRIGLSISSTLKTREYLAKGIPFIYSGDIDVFVDDPVDFCCQISADESPVDIDAVLEFRSRLYEREREECLTQRIREYAEDHVGMERAMKNVADFIKDACGHGSDGSQGA